MTLGQLGHQQRAILPLLAAPVLRKFPAAGIPFCRRKRMLTKCAAETFISYTVLLSRSLRTAADDSTVLVKHKRAKIRL